MKRFFITLAAIVLPISSASGQADLLFTGGSVGQLYMTLLAPVQYTVTSSVAPLFVFSGTGNTFLRFPSVLSTMTYSVNGAGSFAVSVATSGVGYTSALTANDTYVYGMDDTPRSIGDIITLNAGIFSTAANPEMVAPVSGLYRTYLIDSFGEVRSGLGVSTSAVPEPSTHVLTAAGLAGLGVIARRRRRRLLAAAES